jgi:hypothetical protein
MHHRLSVLLLAFHGGGGHAEHMADEDRYELLDKSARTGFAGVFSNGYSMLPRGRFANWNAGGVEGAQVHVRDAHCPSCWCTTPRPARTPGTAGRARSTTCEIGLGVHHATKALTNQRLCMSRGGDQDMNGAETVLYEVRARATALAEGIRDNAQEGTRAFAERLKPVWKGR